MTARDIGVMKRDEMKSFYLCPALPFPGVLAIRFPLPRPAHHPTLNDKVEDELPDIRYTHYNVAWWIICRETITILRTTLTNQKMKEKENRTPLLPVYYDPKTLFALNCILGNQG